MPLLSVSATLIIVSILLVVSPTIAYFNSGEADFPLPVLAHLVPLLGFGAVLVFIVGLVSAYGPSLLKKPLAFVVTFLAIMLGAEAFVLMPNYGTFTGEAVDLSVSPVRYAFEICAVIFALVIARGWLKSPKIPSVALIAIAGAMTIPSVWWALTEEKSAPEPLDEETVFSMGDQNLLVVLLDGFPSDVFEEIVEANGDLRDSLSGFTYYPDTVGVSRTTFLALPSIHSGAVYRPGVQLQQFFKEAITNRSFMGQLSAAGYSSVLINPINGACPEGTECVHGTIVLRNYNQMLKTGLARLMGLSLFSSAPLALKETIYDQGRWLLPPLVADPRVIDHNVEGVEILKLLAEKMSARGNQATAKFVHVLTPHLPVVFEEGCSHSAVPIPATREAFVTQSECALSGFLALVDSLKQRGLYDSTAIILLSDHGQGLSNRKADGDGEWKKLSGSANPLLAIKPLQATGSLQVSSEARWLPEVPSLVCILTGACKAARVNFERGRIYNYYEWKNSYWNAEQLPVTQHSLSGPPWMASSWQVLEQDRK